MDLKDVILKDDETVNITYETDGEKIENLNCYYWDAGSQTTSLRAILQIIVEAHDNYVRSNKTDDFVTLVNAIEVGRKVLQQEHRDD